MDKGKFGKMKIWKNGNLEIWKIEILKNENLEKWKLGKKQIGKTGH